MNRDERGDVETALVWLVGVLPLVALTTWGLLTLTARLWALA